MPRRILTVPFADDLLDRLARLLLDSLPGAAAGDLSGGLVLLPSSRACRDLQQRLLERSGREALVLPRLVTDTQWADELAAALGLGDEDLPDDRVRPLLLARRLVDVDWLEGGPSAAPGLADAFVAFFDEIRRHRVDGRILRARDTSRLEILAGEAAAEEMLTELEHIRQAWELYRQAVPRDRTDRLAEAAAAAAAGRGLPAERPALVVAAGFGRVDPVRAELLAAALDLGRDHQLVVPEAADPLDRRLLATWGDDQSVLDPLAPTRTLLAALGAPALPAGGRDRPLGERLAALPAPDRDIGTVAAPTPAREAVAVAGLVAGRLAREGGAPEGGVTVAVNDPALAARITARLNDAGIDADNTVGAPLASLPAGLLLRFLLRSALTGLRAEPLLEVLTHPYVELGAAGGGKSIWALRLEQMIRMETGPQVGLAGLYRRAQEHDEAALALLGKQVSGMEDYLGAVVAAFAPLLAAADGTPRPWTELLDALAETWRLCAPQRPLGENKAWPDVTGAYRLLDRLRQDAPRLGVMDLAGFAADLGRLLAAETVTAHRPLGIPVVVTGLVEARLARSGLLVLAGLNDGVFPSASATPPLLPGRVRLDLKLPTWREARARDAELFLRLVHGAPDVVLTWSRERDQQPALPSPLAERLMLAMGRDPAAASADPDLLRPWLAAPPDTAGITAAQALFAAEPVPVPRAAETRPLMELSWTALKAWRDCPYLSLLERGYALRPPEEVRDEFGRREYGDTVHRILREAMQEGAEVRRALAEGRAADAVDLLSTLAREHFAPGADELPQRSLWLDTFLAIVPEVVNAELNRFAGWRPAACEAPFRFGLADLHAWVAEQARTAGEDAPPPPAAHAAGVVIKGSVDRIDRSLLEDGVFAVLDYKTGKLPSHKDVENLEDLQLAVYALAVELGAVPGCRGWVRDAVFYPLIKDKCGPALNRGKREATPLCREPGEPGLLLPAARELLRLAEAASDPAAPAALLPRHVDPAVETKAGLPCSWCELRGSCRIEERAMPPQVVLELGRIVARKETR